MHTPTPVAGTRARRQLPGTPPCCLLSARKGGGSGHRGQHHTRPRSNAAAGNPSLLPATCNLRRGEGGMERNVTRVPARMQPPGTPPCCLQTASSPSRGEVDTGGCITRALPVMHTTHSNHTQSSPSAATWKASLLPASCAKMDRQPRSGPRLASGCGIRAFVSRVEGVDL